ncbi:heparinase II/III domain-containing protein [Nonomuraea endophytica]|uniref:CBM6 domain-containing protein n=1 Tax=Nonomuraea endophytica TaxID=714136 RepID=A0A7W8AA26_9ACTN|nr:heparinase II/III family protein [Nonomuraea endophytica]MBB5082342.1 hypothetical protein [Nonomuraea endophytica]
MTGPLVYAGPGLKTSRGRTKVQRGIMSVSVVCLLLVQFLIIGSGSVKAAEAFNGGFETVANGKPDGWVSLAGQHESSTEQVRGGAYSAKLIDSSSSGSTGLRSSRVSVVPGETYEASAYSFNLAGTSQLYLEFWDSSDVRIDYAIKTNSTTSTWNKLNLEEVAPASAAYATLLVYQHSSNIGTAYFDDTSLTMLPPAPQFPFNGKFEEAVDGKPTGWISHSGHYESSTEVVYDGSKSIKLFDPAGGMGTGVRSLNIPVVPDETYKASIYSYNLEGKSQLYLEFWDSSNVRIDYVVGTNSTSQRWNAINLERTAPANASYATLLVYQSVANVGTAYFDAAEIRPELANGGFELVRDGLPADWKVVAGQFESSTEQVSSGHYSAKLADDSTTTGAAARSSKYPADAGKTYEASADIHVLQGKGQVFLEFWDSSDKRIGVYPVVGAAASKWRRISVAFEAPANTTYATILLYIDVKTVGTVFYDNVLLRLKLADVIRQHNLAVPGHPRLYFTSDDISKLQTRSTDPTTSPFGSSGQKIWSDIIASANKYLVETNFRISYYGGYQVTYNVPVVQPSPMAVPPDWTGTDYYPYWTALSKQIQLRMETLSLAYLVSNNADYGDRAKEYLLTLATWDTWSDPSIDYGYFNGSLEHAHLTLAAATTYDMLYNHLSSAERSTVEAKLENLGLKLLYQDARILDDNNIQVLRVVALASASAAVLGNNPDADKYLSRAEDYLTWYLDERMESGQNEGMSYYSYATDNLLRVADQISRVTGSNSSLLEHPFIDDFVVQWAVNFVSTGGAGLANFGDSRNSYYFNVTMSIINARLGNGDAGWYLAKAKPETNLFDQYIYFNVAGTITAPDASKVSSVLEEVGWASMRTGWESDDTLLAFTSNNSMLGHNHYDQNSFIIANGTTWLAADPGYADFSRGPANDFTMRYGHNTVLVDDASQSQKGGGVLLDGLQAPTYSYVKGSAEHAYQVPSLERFDRHIVQVDRDYYVILDDLESTVAKPFWWNLYTGNLATIEVDGVPVANGSTTNGNDLHIAKRDAQMAVKVLDSSPRPVVVSEYTGAENFGRYLKVGTGAAQTHARFLSVLKAEKRQDSGFMHVKDLPVVSSSGKGYSISALLDTNFGYYQAESVGDYITYKLSVDESGIYDLGAHFMRWTVNGKIHAKLDGVPIGNEVDLYSSNFAYQISPKEQFGQFFLTAGDHELRLEVVGKNEQASNFYIGLDSVMLEKVGAIPGPKTAIDAIRVENSDALGTKVNRSPSLTDLVLFRKGEGTYALSGVTSDAEQMVVSYDGKGEIEGYAMTRGASLTFNGQVLLTGGGRLSSSFSYDASAGKDSGVVEIPDVMDVTAYSRTSPSSVVVDGVAVPSNEYSYDSSARTLTIESMAAGRHDVIIRYGS